MAQPQKIIWAEGILLGQQHFQQWECYWQHYYWTQLQGMQHYPYGLIELDFAIDALSNGQFQLQRCVAIFPNGQLIQYDNSYQSVLNYQFQLKPGATKILYLCLPAGKKVSGISGYPDLTHVTPYRANYRQITDELDPQREREVLFSELNLMLRTEAELEENMHRLAVAKIQRNNQGGYELADDFIPTAISIKAAKILFDRLRQWENLLISKINYLQTFSANSSGALNAKELQWLIILPWLSRCVVQLQQIQAVPVCHPYQVFLLLMETLAILTGQNKDRKNVPAIIYLHDNLSATFFALEMAFKELLNALLPVSSNKIELLLQSEGLYISSTIAAQLLAEQQFILAAQAQTENVDWMSHFMRQIKVSAPATLESILTSALPGVKLKYLSRPPQYLEVKIGYEYFYLEPAGIDWDAIHAEKKLAIFIPAEFSHTRIELITIPK